jgi:hypothetical protein
MPTTRLTLRQVELFAFLGRQLADQSALARIINQLFRRLPCALHPRCIIHSTSGDAGPIWRPSCAGTPPRGRGEREEFRVGDGVPTLAAFSQPVVATHSPSGDPVTWSRMSD